MSSKGAKVLGVIIPIIAVLATIGTGVGFAMSMKGKGGDNTTVNRKSLLAEGTQIGNKYKLVSDYNYGNQVNLVPNSSVKNHFNDYTTYEKLYKQSTIGFNFVMDVAEVEQDMGVVLDNIQFQQLPSKEYLPSFDVPDRLYGFYPEYLQVTSHLEILKIAEDPNTLGNSVADYCKFEVNAINDETDKRIDVSKNLPLKELHFKDATDGRNVKVSEQFKMRLNEGKDDDTYGYILDEENAEYKNLTDQQKEEEKKKGGLSKYSKWGPLNKHMVLEQSNINSFSSFEKLNANYANKNMFADGANNKETVVGFLGTIRTTINEQVESSVTYQKELFELCTQDDGFTASKGTSKRNPLTSYKICIDQIDLAYHFDVIKQYESIKEFRSNDNAKYTAQLYPNPNGGFDVDDFNNTDE